MRKLWMIMMMLILPAAVLCAPAMAEETRRAESAEAFRAAFEELADGLRQGFSINTPKSVYEQAVKNDREGWPNFYGSCGALGYQATTLERDGRITVTFDDVNYYAGKRIWAACVAGRTNVLTNRERDTLEKARSIASRATGSDLQRERYLHDWLCNHVSYYLDGIEANDNDCAIGALLDGRADCDGYSDAFYLLCRLAGLECRHISGSATAFRGQGDGGHMWNAIRVNGTWVMVDVTWDDQDTWISNVYYNIGTDRLRRNHRWTERYLTVTPERTDRANLRDADQMLVTAATAADLDAAVHTLSRRGGTSFTAVLGGAVTADRVKEALKRYGADTWSVNTDPSVLEFLNITWHEYFLYCGSEQEAIDWINRYASATVRPAQLVILFPDSLGRQLFADSLNGVERVLYSSRLTDPIDWSYSTNDYTVYIRRPSFGGTLPRVTDAGSLKRHFRDALSGRPTEITFMVSGSLPGYGFRDLMSEQLFRNGVSDIEGWYSYGGVRIAVKGIRYYPEFRVVQTVREAVSYIRECRTRGVSQCRIFFPDDVFADLMANDGRGVSGMMEEAGWNSSRYSFSTTYCEIMLGN
ncbi:MAG: hypothetical protein IJK28_00435 [Clostridia bacterium]|nr:hypothetical protein [Clostridia bacterium]